MTYGEAVGSQQGKHKRKNQGLETRNQDQSGDSDEDDGKINRKVQDQFNELFGEQEPLRIEDVESLITDTISAQTIESDKRLESRFQSFELNISSLLKDNAKEIRQSTSTLIMQQNRILATLVTEVNNKLQLSHENVADMARQTNTTMAHPDRPIINIRNTVAAAKEQTRSGDSST